MAGTCEEEEEEDEKNRAVDAAQAAT